MAIVKLGLKVMVKFVASLPLDCVVLHCVVLRCVVLHCIVE